MDHGELNVPLAKRGDIDRQLDAYKAKQAAAAKKTAREASMRNADLRMQAKAVLASMSDEQQARIAQKAGITVKQAAKQLRSMAYFAPALIVALQNK